MPQIIALILFYLFLYFAVGSIVRRLVPVAEYSIGGITLVGFFTYHLLFMLFCLPLKLTLQPLSLLSGIWSGVLVLITILFFIAQKGNWSITKNAVQGAFCGKQKYITILFFLLILLQLLWFNQNDETYAIWDQSYFLGDQATSLYTNTISQYNPYTGNILEYLNPEYLLETYQNHGAVMCQIFQVHPMIDNLTVMASVVILLSQLLFFEIGKFLFHQNRGKSLLMSGFLFLLNIFSFNFFTPAEFLIIRSSEGKTIMAVLILPMLLYLFLQTAFKPTERSWWIYSFLTVSGSLGLNMSSIYMIPFEITAFYLPMAVARKKFSPFFRCILLLLPCAVFVILYLLTKNSHFIYTGKQVNL